MEYTHESHTGTEHIVDRYERQMDEDTWTAFTECGLTFEVNETGDKVEIDGRDICGACK